MRLLDAVVADTATSRRRYRPAGADRTRLARDVERHRRPASTPTHPGRRCSTRQVAPTPSRRAGRRRAARVLTYAEFDARSNRCRAAPDRERCRPGALVVLAMRRGHRPAWSRCTRWPERAARTCRSTPIIRPTASPTSSTPRHRSACSPPRSTVSRLRRRRVVELDRRARPAGSRDRPGHRCRAHRPLRPEHTAYVHLHLRLHRSAQGRRGPARRDRQPAALDARRVRHRRRRRGAAEDRRHLRPLGLGVLVGRCSSAAAW